MNVDSTRDFPMKLKLNEAATQLAPKLYYQSARVWGGGLLWEALSPASRQRYVTEAYLALRACAPKRDPITKFLNGERPKLVVR
jgi:hypothetical protein